MLLSHATESWDLQIPRKKETHTRLLGIRHEACKLMDLLIVPGGPVIGLEANILGPTVSQLGVVPLPSFPATAYERAPFDF